MNQGRIWTVVNPNHGLPLFLGSVALMSFTVHYAVLSNSSWYKGFYDGVPMTKSAAIAPADPAADVAVLPSEESAVEKTATLAVGSTGPLVVKVKPKAETPG
jgi:light-harvesting protein B-800-850 alpha chain